LGRWTSSSSPEADLLRAQIAFAVNRGSDAPPLLLTAAKRLEALDVGLHARRIWKRCRRRCFVGRLARAGSLLEVAQAAREAPTRRSRRAQPIFSWMAWRS